MRNSVGKMTWVQGSGGPLLLLARSLLPWWSGGRSSNPPHDYVDDPDEDCDYKRACAISDYLGLIYVGGGTGLVLNDVPLATTWRSLDANRKAAGMLARWQCADNEDAMLQAMMHVPADIWEPTGITFKVGAGPLCLFDSAYPGTEIRDDESLSITIPASSYSIETGVHRPNKSTELLLHRFART